MKKLAAAWAGVLAVLSPQSFNNVADAWIAHNNNALSIRNNADAFPFSPVSMLEVQWGETYKFVKPLKRENGLYFVFETILGTLFDIRPDCHSHCAAKEVSFDLQSTEYENKTGILTLDDCQQECHSDSNCVGAVYQAENHTCRFFSKISGLTANVHTAIVLPTCNQACFDDGYKFSGTEMSLVVTTNPLICQAFCRNNSACSGFSWNKQTGQCSQRGDGATLVKDGDYVSGRRDLCTGLLPPKALKDSVYSDSASKGDHFTKSFRIMSADACRVECLGVKFCLSYDYDTKRRICYLKRGRGSRLSSSGIVTGTRFNDASCYKSGYLFEGKSVKVIKDVNHPSECHTECYGFGSCSTWSWNPNMKSCNLFTNGENTRKLADGAYCGPKEPCSNDEAYQFSDFGCARKGIKYGDTPLETVSATDPPACQSKCYASPICEAFSFDSSTNKCHFHLAVAVRTQVRNQYFISGPKKCGGCHSNDKYYSGEQAGELDDVESADECHLHCQATRYCAYWSYTTDSKECTFYKEGSVAKTGKNNITGPKYCDGACDLRGFQATTPSFGFSQNVGKKNLQDCRKACKNNKNCVTFTHHPNNTCTLSDATSLRNLTSGNNMSYVFGFSGCASCIQEGVGYRATEEAYLWSIVAHNAQECQKWCELVELCTYFSYNFRTKQCSLLSGKTEEETGEHLVSGPAQCVPETSCILKDVGLTNVDNLLVERVPTVEDCQELCKETVACKFFTYDSAKKLCTLKSGGLSWRDNLRTQPQKGFLTGTKKCIPDGGEVCEHHNYSFYGRLLDETPEPAQSNEECRKICLKEPRCRFWVYNKAKKECYKRALSGPPMQNSFVPDNNIFAGSRLGCPRCLKAGLAYGGQKIMVAQIPSETVCQQWCEVVDGCEVFTFVKEVCTLYKQPKGPHPASTHTISGPSKC